MTAKEKAIELVHRYDTMQSVIEGFSLEDAKQCALIAVDEIMKAVGWEEMELGVDRDNYWEEVKKEIELL
jgi:hypothetical protein